MEARCDIMARYSRGAAIVFGVLVILTFTMILIVATPAREMLKVYGSNGTDPVSEIASWYSLENLECALKEMSCNLTGLD